MFLSIIGSSLGGIEISTKSLVEHDPQGLRRLTKTGFECVFHLAPLETCASLVLNILRGDESFNPIDVGAVIFASSNFASTSDWPEEVMTQIGFPKKRRCSSYRTHVLGT